MIDLSPLIQAMGGNEQLAQKFLNIFKSQSPKQMAELTMQIENNDWEGVSTTAHSLKTQFYYLNLTHLAQPMEEVERLADTHQTENLHRLVAQLNTTFMELFEKEMQA
jgi:HPt (histidine-containing phosphotransfer) domain-containing protein